MPTATLDLPIHSANAMEARNYEGFVENMPPEKTPITIILKPKVEKTEGKPKTEMQNWMDQVQHAGKDNPPSDSGSPPADDTEKDKTDKSEKGK